MTNILQYISDKFKEYTTPGFYTINDGLLYWREKVLLEVIFILFVTAFIAYIPSVILSITEEIWSIAIADTIVYLVLLWLFFNKKLTVKFRTFSLLTLSYLLGVILVLVVGPFGAGYLWLFVLPILAGTLLEKYSAIWLLIINFVSLIILGLAQYYVGPYLDYGVPFSIVSWIVISANFIFLNILITFAVNVLIRGLQQSLGKEKVMISTLEKQNEETIAAKEEAEKADKVKTEFLAQMSHEIRTPINTILGFTDLIKSSLGNRLNEEQRESFGMISNASKRIIRTIDLILNMSELQTESFKPIMKRRDLYFDIIQPLVNESKRQAIEKGIKIVLENKAASNIIYADEYTVNQIFANLIDNAIKYTEEGEIKISLYEGDNKLKASVNDTGIGISEEYLKNIFTPFSQEDKGYTRKYDGNGLGLTLVKKYCEINNADIKIESKKNLGTTVTVIFPSESNLSSRNN